MKQRDGAQDMQKCTAPKKKGEKCCLERHSKYKQRGFRAGNAAVKWQLLPKEAEGTGAPTSPRPGRCHRATKVGKDLQDQQFHPFRLVHPWEAWNPSITPFPPA